MPFMPSSIPYVTSCPLTISQKISQNKIQLRVPPGADYYRGEISWVHFTIIAFSLPLPLFSAVFHASPAWHKVSTTLCTPTLSFALCQPFTAGWLTCLSKHFPISFTSGHGHVIVTEHLPSVLSVLCAELKFREKVCKLEGLKIVWYEIQNSVHPKVSRSQDVMRIQHIVLHHTLSSLWLLSCFILTRSLADFVGARKFPEPTTFTIYESIRHLIPRSMDKRW